jgi:heme A synthase
VPQVHAFVGFVIVTVFAVGWIWGLVAWIAKRDPGEKFWVWLAVAQVLAGLQAVLGLVLLALGKRPDVWLHYVYGFGPIVILVIAHSLARDLDRTEPGSRPLATWVPFAAAGFICFGLTLRALMTGLGKG